MSRRLELIIMNERLFKRRDVYSVYTEEKLTAGKRLKCFDEKRRTYFSSRIVFPASYRCPMIRGGNKTFLLRDQTLGSTQSVRKDSDAMKRSRSDNDVG